MWTSPLWIKRILLNEPANIDEWIVAYLFVGLIVSFFWSIVSWVVFVIIAAMIDTIRTIEEDGWLNWIPLLFGKRGK